MTGLGPTHPHPNTVDEETFSTSALKGFNRRSLLLSSRSATVGAPPEVTPELRSHGRPARLRRPMIPSVVVEQPKPPHLACPLAPPYPPVLCNHPPRPPVPRAEALEGPADSSAGPGGLPVGGRFWRSSIFGAAPFGGYVVTRFLGRCQPPWPRSRCPDGTATFLVPVKPVLRCLRQAHGSSPVARSAYQKGPTFTRWTGEHATPPAVQSTPAVANSAAQLKFDGRLRSGSSPGPPLMSLPHGAPECEAILREISGGTSY